MAKIIGIDLGTTNSAVAVKIMNAWWADRPETRLS